jgi:glycosyltransferase involved in cell wall biosynthesis
MTVFWDITKASNNRVSSGLNRVSGKLRTALEEAGIEVKPLCWHMKRRLFVDFKGVSVFLSEKDWWITPELFSEQERPGFETWMRNSKGRKAAVYHDAIPLKYPEFTWPKSVARHPFYLKMLAGFDHILANSKASQEELLAYWKWLGVGAEVPITAIPLGADFNGNPRVRHPSAPAKGPLRVLMTGILEPRKNHVVVLDAMELLHREGLAVRLDIVGRVNPHFGNPILKRIHAMVRAGYPVNYHNQISDHQLDALYHEVQVTVFPSLAEGNGLPVIESLWQGKATIVSGIAPHREHASTGNGVAVIEPMDAEALAGQLRIWATDQEALAAASRAAMEHPVPTWEASASAVINALGCRE